MPNRPKIRVNISDQRVWQDGQPVKVKAKVFALLTLFLANPGRLLTKMAILRHVWPDIHVSDASVKDCVKNLRAVLQDDVTAPAFIETVRGQGYRYLGGIEFCNDLTWPGANEDEIPVILIEKFSHASGVLDESKLSDEFRDGLIDVLAQRSRIKIITDPKSDTPPTYILRGRCRVLESRCRLYLSMSAAASGEIFWSTKIDGDVTDIFDFLDRTVEMTGTALRVHTNAFAGSTYVSIPDDTLSVQQLLSKAGYFLYQHDKSNCDLAQKTLIAAYAKAPKNPMVLSLRAFAIAQPVTLAIKQNNEIDVETAMSFANESVHLGSNIDAIFAVRGLLRLWLDRDHSGCLEDQNRALEISPNYHLAKDWGARAKIFGDRREDGLQELEEVLNLVPSEPNNPLRYSHLAIGHALTGNHDAAMINAKEGYDRKPQVRICAIAYAAAAAGIRGIVSSDGFTSMVKQHRMTTADADRFPFASKSDTQLLAEILHEAGVPEEYELSQ